MWQRRLAVSLTVVLIGSSAVPATRHRAIRPPVSDATPAGWLSNHAYRLDDMGPLRIVVGDSPVVGLGDDTHGTHEFFDLKLKMIQFLAREMNFTTLGFEAPFADFNRLNQYVLGGPGEPYTPLMHRELGYWFWASDEIVAVIEWAREYNRTRGDRPPVEIVGFDVTDEKGAGDLAVAYVSSVDPASPVDNIDAVWANLLAHETEFVARSSQRAFDAALQAATVASVANRAPSQLDEYFAWRDQNMATNVIQLQQRRSSNGRVILWGHQEHLGKTVNIQGVKPAGRWLDDRYGRDYFVIGSSSGGGRFNVLAFPNTQVVTTQYTPITPDSYEANFRSVAIPIILIPLRGDLPGWLGERHHLRGGTAVVAYDRPEDLKVKFDAIVYIDQTTRSSNFW
ncbi:MAG TPA: erythromycin esterase family protein [Thermoanaerobaculia bacterium]|nr:erythromycin esterase family protein [Thermoanaerobaculia bacterium]